MIGTAQLDEFVANHRWAVVTTLRKDGTPSSSVNAYAREGDTLVISTQAHRLKVKTLENDPRITVCVISNREPFNFVTVEGTCVIERENIAEPTRTVFRNLAPTGYQPPEDLEEWMREQHRVILRVTPVRVSGVIRS
jgi:PPOX class probable F420-dependent enzyme